MMIKQAALTSSLIFFVSACVTPRQAYFHADKHMSVDQIAIIRTPTKTERKQGATDNSFKANAKTALVGIDDGVSSERGDLSGMIAHVSPGSYFASVNCGMYPLILFFKIPVVVQAGYTYLMECLANNMRDAHIDVTPIPTLALTP